MGHQHCHLPSTIQSHLQQQTTTCQNRQNFVHILHLHPGPPLHKILSQNTKKPSEIPDTYQNISQLVVPVSMVQQKCAKTKLKWADKIDTS